MPDPTAPNQAQPDLPPPSPAASQPNPGGAAARITVDDVAHVARLALLELTPEELVRFTGQLAAVLDHARDVEALDLADIEPLLHPLPLRNVFRADEPGAALDRDEVLNQAPSSESGRFRVPAILGEQP
ncbi:MAG: Asp-tRNA(Asn)/Glu-tRNA(Gln) amidotransferase subunit GatC [Acidimicrobiales bacterium]